MGAEKAGTKWRGERTTTGEDQEGKSRSFEGGRKVRRETPAGLSVCDGLCMAVCMSVCLHVMCLPVCTPMFEPGCFTHALYTLALGICTAPLCETSIPLRSQQVERLCNSYLKCPMLVICTLAVHSAVP